MRFLCNVLFCILLLSSVAWAQLTELRLQNAASSGNGSNFTINGQSTLLVTFQGTSDSDRTITFNADDGHLGFQNITCQNTKTLSLDTSVVVDGNAIVQYMCPVSGFKTFQAPITLGSAGSVTVWAKSLSGVLLSLAGSSTGTGSSCFCFGKRFSQDFSNQTSFTVLATTHGFAAKTPAVELYDTSGHKIGGNVVVNTSTFDITISFVNSQSGYYVIH